MPNGPADGGQPEVVQPEIVGFCERAWFERAFAVAETDALRRQVARLAAAAVEAELRRSAWLDDVESLAVSWFRAADSVPPNQLSRWFIWADQSGFHVVNRTDGRPVWGGGASERLPLFPRNHGLEGTALVRDTRIGSVVAGAGRLVGLVSLPLVGQVSCQLVALDLAPAAEGRLIWCRPITELTSVATAGLVADSSLCVAVSSPVNSKVWVSAVDARNGRILWQHALPASDVSSEAKRPSVVICQQFVVLMLPTGRLIALDRSNGNPVWQQDDLGHMISSSFGMKADVLVSCVDRLVVLLRPAGGMPKLVHVAITDGSLLGQSQLVLAQGSAAESTARDTSMETNKEYMSDKALLGRPTVLNGRAVWPVGQVAGSPPRSLLISRLLTEDVPFIQQEVPLTMVARLRQIKAQPEESAPVLLGRSRQRLGLLAGGRFWCLSPGMGVQETDEPSVP